MTENETPVWQLAERWTKEAKDRIAGRANFEQYVGRKSTKPIQPIEVDARDLLRVLTEAAEFKERVESVLRSVNAYADRDGCSEDEREVFADVAIWLTKALHPEAVASAFATTEGDTP